MRQTDPHRHTHKSSCRKLSNLKVFLLPNTRKTNETFPVSPPKEGCEGGRNPIRSQPHEAPGGSLCVENRNHKARRTGGGLGRGGGGKKKVTPEDIKSPVDCVCACERERGEALCCGAWTGTKADSLQMEDREIKKGKEGER